MALSWLYGGMMNLRNALYERGVFKSYSLGAPAISVGNVTVGGTGKTPFVAFAAGMLAERGAQVCILTRGYGRENPKSRVLVADGEEILAGARQAGDEPFELARKLRGKAIVIADANRVSAAQWAREKFDVTVFVLDDAFQHRRAKRELDIVLLDATNPFGNSKTLPFGRLREPLENLRRAGLLVITRADLVEAERIADYKFQISKFNPNCPVFTAKNRVSQISSLADSKIQNPKSKIQNPKSLAFCALGNPDNFFEQLRREKFNLTTTRKFPDHHRYTPEDIEKLEAAAAREGAEILLTTAKDAVKLADLKFEMPCFVIESEMIFDDEKKLREIIGAVLKAV